MTRLAGKVAVITGGGAGIGRASSRLFAAEGASVVVAEIDAGTGEASATEAELEQRIAETEAALARHPAAYPHVIATSSKSGAGMGDLRAAVMKLLAERG